MKRLLLATAIALLALPALAHASTCQRVGGAVAVHMGGSSDVANISRVGDAIYNGITPCDDATVHNVHAVFITDTSPGRDGNDFVGIDLSGGPFAPGTDSAKNGQVPEITFELYLQHGENFVLVTGSGGPDTIRGGRTIDYNGHYLQGLNLNPVAESQPGKVADPDVVWQYATPYPNPPANETFQIDGAAGGDTIDLSGGPGFDTAFFADTTIYGGTGDDHLKGGDMRDTLYADSGDDVLDGGVGLDWVTFETALKGVTADFSNPNPQETGAFGKDQFRSVELVRGSQYDDVLTARDGGSALYGMGGNDLLLGRAGNDGFDGGPGSDTASYVHSPAGVSVDLANDKGQNTGGAGTDYIAGIENLTGGPHSDDLTGDAGPNTIDGGGGNDSVTGRGGSDQLLLRDGGPDQATCGAEADLVLADPKGTDTIFGDCENLDFAPFVPAPAPTPTPGSGSGSGTPPSGDHTAPVLSKLKLKGRTLSYKLSEAATVKFRIELRTGRKWKALRTRTQARASGPNKLRLNRRGRYRVTATATDAAGNKSKKRALSFRVKR